MTDAPQPDLTAIRERLEKATKGPWTLERSICGGGGWHWARVMGGDAMRGFESVEDAGWFHEDDAELIAHAPEDIAALLALVSTLTAERERIKALVVAMRKTAILIVERSADVAHPVAGELDDCAAAIDDILSTPAGDPSSADAQRWALVEKVLGSDLPEFGKLAAISCVVESRKPYTEADIEATRRVMAMIESKVTPAGEARGDGTLRCMDCSVPYADFPLDTTLSDDQWKMIHRPEGGVLCASCIVRRASRLPGVVAVRAVFEFAGDLTAGDKLRTLVHGVEEMRSVVRPAGEPSSPTGSIKKRDTPEQRAHWDFVEKTAKRVRENRPAWGDTSEPSTQETK